MAHSSSSIEQFKRDRVYKRLNYLDSPQSARVRMEGRGEILILSSNNYLGLCDEPSVIEAGIDGLRRYGAGTGERALHLRHVHDSSRARRGARAVRRNGVVAELRLGVERQRGTHRARSSRRATSSSPTR